MSPLIGSIGIGLVCGWLLVFVAAGASERLLATAVALVVASVVVGAAIYTMAGFGGVAGFASAAAIAATAAIAIRRELARSAGPGR